MAILGSVLNVVFVIICILLILLILMQSGRSSGMSLFGGSASQTAFGANSADILTKTTAVLVGLFMAIGIGMALIKSKDNNLQKIQEKIKENAGIPTEDNTGVGLVDDKAANPAVGENDKVPDVKSSEKPLINNTATPK